MPVPVFCHALLTIHLTTLPNLLFSFSLCVCVYLCVSVCICVYLCISVSIVSTSGCMCLAGPMSLWAYVSLCLSDTRRRGQQAVHHTEVLRPGQARARAAGSHGCRHGECRVLPPGRCVTMCGKAGVGGCGRSERVECSPPLSLSLSLSVCVCVLPCF